MPQINEPVAHSPEIQFVVFRLRDEEFGIEIGSVREIIRIPEITKIPDSPGYISGVINLRGEVLAIVDLANEFELPPLAKLTNLGRIIVIEISDNTVGIIVDEVSQIIKLTAQNIEPTPELTQSEINQKFIQGVGKIDQKLLLLLDINEIIEPMEIHKITTITKEA